MENTNTVPMFTPEQIIRDVRFAPRADALRVVLTGEKYTLEEARAALNEFMERTVE